MTNRAKMISVLVALVNSEIMKHRMSKVGKKIFDINNSKYWIFHRILWNWMRSKICLHVNCTRHFNARALKSPEQIEHAPLSWWRRSFDKRRRRQSRRRFETERKRRFEWLYSPRNCVHLMFPLFRRCAKIPWLFFGVFRNRASGSHGHPKNPSTRLGIWLSPFDYAILAQNSHSSILNSVIDRNRYEYDAGFLRNMTYALWEMGQKIRKKIVTADFIWGIFNKGGDVIMIYKKNFVSALRFICRESFCTCDLIFFGQRNECWSLYNIHVLWYSRDE